MGVVPNKKSLVQTEKLSASSFCRRRLAVVMMRIKMAETLKEACTFIEQVSRVWDVNAYQATVTHHQDSGGCGWTGWGLLQHRCFKGDEAGGTGQQCRYAYSLAVPNGQQ